MTVIRQDEVFSDMGKLGGCRTALKKVKAHRDRIKLENTFLKACCTVYANMTGVSLETIKLKIIEAEKDGK